MYIKQLRAHLDSVRRAEGRPTVALVLSGGGAKGAAQVGALKYLEEQNIPVDIVFGTSIGGLLGGLYAVGYTSQDMRDLFCTQDWGKTLTDKVDPEHISYVTKLDRQKYLVNIPFHYEKVKTTKRRHGHSHESYSDGSGAALKSIGANGEAGVSTQKGANNFTSSLPTGYAYGFNINNLLTSLTVGYQDSISFATLPRPYLCVASDMVSLKAKYWSSGSLKTAMRSTMSIPGLFNPVRTQEMILVDGGTRNNYPTDFARAAGADYIIGIELADADPEYSDVHHLGNILGQFIKMLGKDAYDKNIDYPFVRVKPDLKGFNMLSFTEAAVDTMILRGYKAFEEKADELAAIKEVVGEARPHKFRKAVDISKTPVQIKSVVIDDVDENEAKLLMKKINLNAGQYVDKGIMDDAMSKIQATGAFESVTYALLGTESPYDLVFSCNRGPTHELGVGLRIDSEEWAAVQLRLGLNTRKLMGAKFNFEARLSRSQRVYAKYSQDIPYFPTLNVEAYFRHNSFDLFDKYDNTIYKGEWEHSTACGKLFLSDNTWTRFNFELGLQYKYFFMDPKRSTTMLAEAIYPGYTNTPFAGAFASASLYTMDNINFPTKGVKLDFKFDADLAKPGTPDFKPIYTAAADFRFVVPIGNVFSIIPDIHWRSSFNNEDSRSYYHMNFIGGDLAGRFIEHQIPFVGCNRLLNTHPHAAVINVDLRFKLIENLYLSAQGGYVSTGRKFTDMFQSLAPEMYGFAGELGYDTIVGPFKFAVKWASKSGWQVYGALGFEF